MCAQGSPSNLAGCEEVRTWLSMCLWTPCDSGLRTMGHIVRLQVSLNLESKAGRARVKPGTADFKRGKSGHAFSASNPYGVKAAGDKRQFVRV